MNLVNESPLQLVSIRSSLGALLEAGDWTEILVIRWIVSRSTSTQFLSTNSVPVLVRPKLIFCINRSMIDGIEIFLRTTFVSKKV